MTIKLTWCDIIDCKSGQDWRRVADAGFSLGYRYISIGGRIHEMELGKYGRPMQFTVSDTGLTVKDVGKRAEPYAFLRKYKERRAAIEKVNDGR